MKTHEISKTLVALAKALQQAPNVNLEQLTFNQPQPSPRKKPNPSDIPMALSALVALSQFDKAQWRAVIEEYKFPIEVRNTESTRDIVGKILRHLEQDSDARRKLKQAVQRTKSDINPELMTALNFLLK
ncbi:hypothetical protein [Bradyrhizobium sp. 45]|uniref:hypothetical protein n=1 Tax=Bradyrhizobium sp. 45 TaxID=1043587 RepID=UPI001FFA60D9|nr:hypothetical protein [Bradyrhizobium sp. 45]MCK1304628.1 hypothetical protein [Bradyrhizobium sp. 45]